MSRLISAHCRKLKSSYQLLLQDLREEATSVEKRIQHLAQHATNGILTAEQLLGVHVLPIATSTIGILFEDLEKRRVGLTVHDKVEKSAHLWERIESLCRQEKWAKAYDLALEEGSDLTLKYTMDLSGAAVFPRLPDPLPDRLWHRITRFMETDHFLELVLQFIKVAFQAGFLPPLEIVYRLRRCFEAQEALRQDPTGAKIYHAILLIVAQHQQRHHSSS